MRISYWSSYVCASDLQRPIARGRPTDMVLQTERAAHPGHPSLVHRVASRRVLPFAGDQLAVLVLVRPAIGNLDEPVRMPLLHLTSEPGFLDGRHDPCDPRRRALRRDMRGVRRRVLPVSWTTGWSVALQAATSANAPAAVIAKRQSALIRFSSSVQRGMFAAWRSCGSAPLLPYVYRFRSESGTRGSKAPNPGRW